MKHIIISREYPPAAYHPGGIGTYVAKIARLLAQQGDHVHVIGQRWKGAPKPVEEGCGGRLIVHRIPLDEPIQEAMRELGAELSASIVAGLARSSFPSQTFAWQAALLAESLIEAEGIDLIEGQEWEAPLYFLQLRRALGLGPARRPPCLIHLHSPTEFIFHYNQWDTNRPSYLPAIRLEEYTITAADALLCPSRYLARQVASRFKVLEERIEVIPYPLGDTPVLQRSGETWKRGSILFIGRLEPRKGVLEWSEAAARVARDDPTVRFDFVGGDTAFSGRGRPTVGQVMKQSIPRELRDRFRFAGVRPTAELGEFLARSRAAVVPSRWENFPNACIESMASGLPVIVTPTGGMVEMVEDGRTGWVAPSASSEGLAIALHRALDTPASRLEAMGLEAAAAIRRLCNDRVIVQRHMELRERVAKRGVSRSLHPAPFLPWSTRSTNRHRTPVPRASSRRLDGIALVVLANGDGTGIDECVAAIERQTRPPAAVAVTVEDPTIAALWPALRHMPARGWHLVEQTGAATARNTGFQAVLGSGIDPLGAAFVELGTRLHPKFVEATEAVLREQGGVGIVSPWVRLIDEGDRLLAPPCPAFPYQWLVDDVAPCAVVRTEAMLEAGFFRTELDGGLAAWDLATAVMANGWVAVTYPALPCDRRSRQEFDGAAHAGRHYMRRAFLERFSEQVGRDASELVLLLEGGHGALRKPGVLDGSLPAHLRRIVRALNRARRHMLRSLGRKRL